MADFPWFKIVDVDLLARVVTFERIEKMTKKTKKRNPGDLTKRNNDARKREIARLRKQVKVLKQTVRTLLKKGRK